MDEVVINKGVCWNCETERLIFVCGLISNRISEYRRIVHIIHCEREGIEHRFTRSVRGRDFDPQFSHISIIWRSAEGSRVWIETQPRRQGTAVSQRGIQGQHIAVDEVIIGKYISRQCKAERLIFL